VAEGLANIFTTTVGVGGIASGAGATSLPVANAAPAALSGQTFAIVVNAGGATQEIMEVTGGQATTTWTVTRASEPIGAAGTQTASAHVVGETVNAVITAGGLRSFTGTTMLYSLRDQAQVAFQTYHQGVMVMAASGTFVANAPNVVLSGDILCANEGAGAALWFLMAGNNGGNPNNWMLAGDSQAFNVTQPSPVTGVTDWFVTTFGSTGHEGNLFSALSGKLRMTGLTVGTTYTWQLCTAIAQGYAQAESVVSSNPKFMALMPDSGTLWVANNGDATVQPINAAKTPLYSLQQKSPMIMSPGAPIKVGNAPLGIACDPTGKYVAVCNQTDKTVSIINAQTRQLIGTSAVITGTNVTNINCCAFTQDGAVVWVTDNGGGITPLTVNAGAAPTVGTRIVSLNAATDVGLGIVVGPDAKTLYVADNTVSGIYCYKLTSNTTIAASPYTSLFLGGSKAAELAICQTAALCAAGTIATGNQTLSTTVIAGFDNWPPYGMIKIPTASGYVSIPYASTAVTGTTRTFAVNNNTGSTITIAALSNGSLNAVIDEGCWYICPTGLHGKTNTAGANLWTATPPNSILPTDCSVTPDGAEFWIAGNVGTTANYYVLNGQTGVMTRTASTGTDPGGTSPIGGFAWTTVSGIEVSTSGFAYLSFTGPNPGLVYCYNSAVTFIGGRSDYGYIQVYAETSQ
jgi:DNA-binding beta-propeller fold protein YncE